MITFETTISGKEISLASEIAQRYQLASLKPLIDSSRSLLDSDELSVAVIGRFKAGKSSFLNHFLDRDLLPVGVTPVTAVVTEVGYGGREKAVVHFLDGRTQEVAPGDIHHFIAEKENPGNTKQVSLLKIELPQLTLMRALRFVDMPGLESALAHNAEAALYCSGTPHSGKISLTMIQREQIEELFALLIGKLEPPRNEVTLLSQFEISASPLRSRRLCGERLSRGSFSAGSRR